jgi:hypothetical protein
MHPKEPQFPTHNPAEGTLWKRAAEEPKEDRYDYNMRKFGGEIDEAKERNKAWEAERADYWNKK